MLEFSDISEMDFERCNTQAVTQMYWNVVLYTLGRKSVSFSI